jgi:hypothetical protein
MAEKTSLSVETDLGPVDVRMTNLEAFIRGLVSRAIRFGDKQVSDLLAAYIAGKPGRAADPKVEDKTVEEALDRAGVAALNLFVPQEIKENA